LELVAVFRIVEHFALQQRIMHFPDLQIEHSSNESMYLSFKFVRDKITAYIPKKQNTEKTE